LRPANEAPAQDGLRADDLRVGDLRVERDELLLAADEDEAVDDDAGEPLDAELTATARPVPRRAPRLSRAAARSEAEDGGTPVPRPSGRPSAERTAGTNQVDGAGHTGDIDANSGGDANDDDAEGADVAGGVDDAQGAGDAELVRDTDDSVDIDEGGSVAADEVSQADMNTPSDVMTDGVQTADDVQAADDVSRAGTDVATLPGDASDVVADDREAPAPAAAAVSVAPTPAEPPAPTAAAAPTAAPAPAPAEASDDESPLSDVPAAGSPSVEAPRGRRAARSEQDEDSTPTPDLLSAVERLRSHVATLNLHLDVEDVTEARKEHEGIVSQLDDYVIPRLRRKDAPLLAVIGGSTGAGKSTLTNSIVRREVSRSGVLRPTTRSPVLVHHPHDSGAFLSQRILPRLTRVTSEAPEPMQPIDPSAPRITGLRLVPHDGMTPGMAIIDAPDIDSLVETNRDLAVQLLQAADLWIFVTTAARYADAMPWQMLRQAAERGVAVAVVLDRVPPEALAELRVHLAQRLGERGLGGAPLFVIPETQPVDGFLPEEVVRPLQQWLRRVAGDERSRTMIAGRTLKGVLASLPERTLRLADAADAQALAWYKLKQEVDAVFEPARDRLLRSMTDGSLISGEVAARWQEFVADGEFVRRLDGAPGTLAERVSAAVQRDGEVTEPLDVPVTEAIAATVTAAVRAATEAVTSRWRRFPFGVALAERPVPEFEATLERSVRDWRVQVSAAVTSAAQKREQPVDEETAADVLFVVAVDERADAAQAADSIGAARRILGRFLGDDEVRSMVADARSDLVARAAVVLDQERQRLEKLLTGGSATARGESLRAAAAVLGEAR
jgi:dynamin family protein